MRAEDFRSVSSVLEVGEGVAGVAGQREEPSHRLRRVAVAIGGGREEGQRCRLAQEPQAVGIRLAGEERQRADLRMAAREEHGLIHAAASAGGADARFVHPRLRGEEGVIVALSSEDLLRYPFVWLTGHLPVRFTSQERDRLKTYLERGGLLFVDDHNHDIDGAFHKTATEEITRTAGPLVPLPNDHALYRCFFQYPEGPPTTSHELNGWGDNLVHKQLQAVMRGDRIAVLYSNKDYSSEWNFHPESKKFMSVDNTRFFVNMLVYALTR